jgi:cytoskeletal protein RodZ
VVDEKAESAGKAEGVRSDGSLGKFLTAARQRGGYTAEQVAAGTHIPAHYVKALETDDYALISDQLYLLPFLRRYAAFVGLDPEDVASRFVREVQKSEVSIARIAEPIPMMSNERKPGRARNVVAIVVVLGAVALAAVMFLRRELLQWRMPRLSGTEAQTPSSAPPAAPDTAASQGAAAVPFESTVAPAPASEPQTQSPPAAANPSQDDPED